MRISRPILGAAAAATAVTVAVVALTGCTGSNVTTEGSGGDVAVGQGSIKEDPSLKGQKFVVSSKDFSESIILGQITMVALRASGAEVTDKTNIKGSANTRQALTSGEVDMYWEYTGTGWITYLQHTDPIRDPKQQYDAVAAEDREKNKVVWASPAPANNTYALAVREDKAQQWNLKTLSDLAAFAKTNATDATVCLESEFSTRNDGWPGLAKAYGLVIPAANVKKVDTGVIYTETKKAESCNFGEVFATDGRIANLGLVTLTDDKNFFPIYNPALTMRADTAAKYPSLAALFAPIAAKLDDATLRALNEKVDVKGETAAKVAQDWMKEQGFVA